MPHQHMKLALNDGMTHTASALVSEVKILQKALHNWGILSASETIDGKFGQKTEAAVKLFQEKHGLTQDGTVGQQTWAELLKVEAFEIEIIPRPGDGTLNLNAMPSEWQSAAKPYVSILVKAFQDAGIVNPKVLAYACATIGNESSWNPHAENKTDGFAGTAWSGKGLAQVTTPGNYKALTQKTGIDFVNYPDLMFDPYSALRAKAAFYQMNHMVPYIEQAEYQSAAGIYNAGDPNYRSDYTRRVAQQTPQWERIFS